MQKAGNRDACFDDRLLAFEVSRTIVTVFLEFPLCDRSLIIVRFFRQPIVGCRRGMQLLPTSMGIANDSPTNELFFNLQYQFIPILVLNIPSSIPNPVIYKYSEFHSQLYRNSRSDKTRRVKNVLFYANSHVCFNILRSQIATASFPNISTQSNIHVYIILRKTRFPDER